MSRVIQLSELDEFKQVIDGNELVLVDFYATWCRPCQMLGPILDELSEEVDYKIIKVDVDNYPNLAAEHSVRSIPTLVVYKNQEVKTIELGVKSKVELKKLMEEYK